MKSLIVILFLFFFFKQTHSENIKDDEIYYSEGVENYKNGNFDESFIIFFNLSQKDNADAIYNVSNMFFEGIGTTQDYLESLKYTWLCSLNGNKKCLDKIDVLKDKVDEKMFLNVSYNVVDILEKKFENKLDYISAFKLGYWFERISPEVNLEKSYLWYSVSVSGGIYKAMKLRDRVANKLDKDVIHKIQKEANEIHTKEKYFSRKGKK